MKWMARVSALLLIAATVSGGQVMDTLKRCKAMCVTREIGLKPIALASKQERERDAETFDGWKAKKVELKKIKPEALEQAHRVYCDFPQMMMEVAAYEGELKSCATELDIYIKSGLDEGTLDSIAGAVVKRTIDARDTLHELYKLCDAEKGYRLMAAYYVQVVMK